MSCNEWRTKPKVTVRSKFLDRLRSSINSYSSKLKSFKPCLRCGSKLVKNGECKLMHRGKVQRYLCKACKHSFSDNDFPRMRFPKQMVKLACKLRGDGLSLGRVKFRVSSFFNLAIKACSTIWRWFLRFADQAPIAFYRV
jgi:transposase-like protein